jgi:hypothetical protein
MSAMSGFPSPSKSPMSAYAACRFATGPIEVLIVWPLVKVPSPLLIQSWRVEKRLPFEPHRSSIRSVLLS